MCTKIHFQAAFFQSLIYIFRERLKGISELKIEFLPCCLVHISGIILSPLIFINQCIPPVLWCYTHRQGYHQGAPIKLQMLERSLASALAQPPGSAQLFLVVTALRTVSHSTWNNVTLQLPNKLCPRKVPLPSPLKDSFWSFPVVFCCPFYPPNFNSKFPFRYLELDQGNEFFFKKTSRYPYQLVFLTILVLWCNSILPFPNFVCYSRLENKIELLWQCRKARI